MSRFTRAGRSTIGRGARAVLSTLNALLPFFSTKPSGRAAWAYRLCRETVEAHGSTLSIRPRAGGGIGVVCLIP